MKRLGLFWYLISPFILGKQTNAFVVEKTRSSSLSLPSFLVVIAPTSKRSTKWNNQKRKIGLSAREGGYDDDDDENVDRVMVLKLRNDFRTFLNQCTIQSFMFLLRSLRDVETVRWLETFTQPSIDQWFDDEMILALQQENYAAASKILNRGRPQQQQQQQEYVDDTDKEEEREQENDEEEEVDNEQDDQNEEEQDTEELDNDDEVEVEEEGKEEQEDDEEHDEEDTDGEELDDEEQEKEEEQDDDDDDEEQDETDREEEQLEDDQEDEDDQEEQDEEQQDTDEEKEFEAIEEGEGEDEEEEGEEEEQRETKMSSKSSSSPFTQPQQAQLLRYHGLEAINETLFPQWEDYFYELLQQPSESFWVNSSEAHIPNYIMDIDPASLCARMISVREQISKEWVKDLNVIANMGGRAVDSYWERLRAKMAQKLQDQENEKKKNERVDINDDGRASMANMAERHNLMFLEWSADADSDYMPSPLRKHNFDLLTLLTTQEAIHRILNREAVRESETGKTVPQHSLYLRDFYEERVLSHFCGIQRYGRADDFLQELIEDDSAIIADTDVVPNEENANIRDSSDIARLVLEERSKVALDWKEIAEISPREHYEVRRMMLDRRMGIFKGAEAKEDKTTETDDDEFHGGAEGFA